jgi:tRNA-dihydrouridine synthase
MEHAREFESQFGSRQFKRMRKHLGWYCKGFPRAAALRARMFLVSSVAELEAVLIDYHTSVGADDQTEASSSDPAATAPLASRCG